MTAAERRERYHELFVRAKDAMRLGDPVPAVSTEAGNVMIDLLGELDQTIAELERQAVRS